MTGQWPSALWFVAPHSKDDTGSLVNVSQEQQTGGELHQRSNYMSAIADVVTELMVVLHDDR